MTSIKQEVSKFFNIYWNLHTYILNQGIKARQPKAKSVVDVWILSRLNTVIRGSLKALDDFELHLAGRPIYNFVVDDLSRFYVQVIRDRLDEDEIPVHIMNHCLLEISKVLSLISPFITEKVYQNMKGINALKESIHLENLPKPGSSNMDLESMMSVVQDVIASALACRDKAQIGVRWPLQEVIVDSNDKHVGRALKKLNEIIKKQCNVKKVVFKSMSPKVKVSPNFKSLGMDFGTDTGDVALVIKSKVSELEKAVSSGKDEFKVGKFKVLKKHLNIVKYPLKGYELAEMKTGTVYLNTVTTPELENEGFVREVIRRNFCFFL